jgi:flagellar basal body L-ring protein FlgH
MRTGLLAFALLWMAAGPARAEEASEPEKKVEKKLAALYGDGKTQRPLSKPKAHAKHDRVTIVINENTEAKHEASSELDRESSINWQLLKWFTLRVDGEGNLKAVPRLQAGTGDEDTSAVSGQQKPEVQFNSTREHEAEGEIERTSNLTDEISGEVLDVLPNKHLIVQARKAIKVDGEDTSLTLTGKIDPRDLTADSKVSSNKVMDLRVKFEGKGDISDMQKRGWGARILDKLNPF